MEKLDNKISKDCISIKVQEKRTQFETRKLAIYKLITLITEKLNSDTKTRRATKPTQASQKRRVESKKKRGQPKRNRKNTVKKDF